MSTESLIQLRRLADHKQYAPLEQACLKMSQGSDNIGLYPLLTLSQAHLGKVQEARETLNWALRTDTIAQLDFDSRLDLAAAHLALYQLNKAEKLLKQLIELQPDHPLALARYGWCLMAVGKSDAAEQQYTHSARLDPDRVPVWTNLAVLALGRNDFSAMLHAIEKGIPGSTAINDEVLDNTFRNWFYAKVKYQNFFMKKSLYRLGLNLEGHYAFKPFLGNYTSTILSTEQFNPYADSKTIFSPNYRSQQYISAGLTNVFTLHDKLDIRIEAHYFQPIKI